MVSPAELPYHHKGKGYQEALPDAPHSNAQSQAQQQGGEGQQEGVDGISVELPVLFCRRITADQPACSCVCTFLYHLVLLNFDSPFGALG